MFATISFLEQNNNRIKGYKIEYNSFQEIKFINITCFKKQAIKRIEKKIYKKVKQIVVDEKLKQEKFRKLNVINSFEQTSNITKNAFEKILNIQYVNFVCVKDTTLKNTEFIKSIITKCGLINIITNNPEDFFEFSEKMYSEFGVLLLFNNENFNSQLGIDLDDNYIWFVKLERKYYARQGSAKFNQTILDDIPKGIDVNEFVFALSQEKEFNSLKIEKDLVLERNDDFYEINEQTLKKFLDN